MANRFIVEHFTLADGWVNTWSTFDDDDNAIPSVFDTREEAEQALRDFFADQEQFINSGELPEDCAYSLSEFRVTMI